MVGVIYKARYRNGFTISQSGVTCRLGRGDGDDGGGDEGGDWARAPSMIGRSYLNGGTRDGFGHHDFLIVRRLGWGGRRMLDTACFMESLGKTSVAS